MILWEKDGDRGARAGSRFLQAAAADVRLAVTSPQRPLLRRIGLHQPPLSSLVPRPTRVPKVDPSALAVWALAFTLVSYLALRSGGYDIAVRSQAGVVIWWLLLIGALTGILPTRFGKTGWIAIGLLCGFAVWTGVAIGWTTSTEQTVIELGRVAAYLGVLTIAILLQGRTAARHTINGLACAFALVAGLAVLSRLHPQWFPANPHLQFLGTPSARKLSYPLNYWNALAAFAAMGVPLNLSVAVGARRLLTRSLAAAMLPLSALCIYLTVSRGGAIALGFAIAVFVLLVPRRLESIGTLLVAGLASAFLLRATAVRSALTAGLPTPTAIHQGTSLLALTAIACLAVALAQVAMTIGIRRIELPRALTPDRSSATRRALVVLGVALIAALALGLPSKLTHAWTTFKQPIGLVAPHNNNALFSRLAVANGNNRYQFWLAALHANETHPWRGIGPGTFQLWYAQHPTADEFVRNAHSLYLETLAETGIVGLALLGGLVLCFIAVAARRALTEPPGLRLWLGAASASLAAFLVSATFEWVWQLASIAAAALILGAVIVAGHDERSPGPTPAASTPVASSLPRRTLARAAPYATRSGVVVLAVIALAAILIPLAGQTAIRNSQAAAANGRLGLAVKDSLAAERLQPYSAAAYLQEALVLEAAGALDSAAQAARAATVQSPSDWTTWLTLARIDARRGATQNALAEFRRMRLLNPRFSMFPR